MIMPIILIEPKSKYVCLYYNKEKLENHLEGVDIENKEYVLYDAEGQVLSPKVSRKRGKYLKIIPFEKESVVINESNTYKIKDLVSHLSDIYSNNLPANIEQIIKFLEDNTEQNK